MKRLWLLACVAAVLALTWRYTAPSSSSSSSPLSSPSSLSSSLSASSPTSSSPPPSPPSPTPESHPHAPGAPSHPITPERERIQRENQLVGALNDAMDLNDVNEMRRLISIYREHDPSDANKLQEGYTRIADCLQSPGEEALSRAQHYYDTERASTLRRYVRRACFER